MPIRKRRPPVMEEHYQEPPEDDEVREGSEQDDSPLPQHSRKRSARGAKRTKAPMDAEGGCNCGGGRRKKCTCDGACGSKKMDSVLTPQEYLDACDLGIQDRSTSYIRTHLSVMASSIRADKKCGNSNIPDNRQCRAGAGAGGSTLRRVATGAAVVGGLAAAGYGGYRFAKSARGQALGKAVRARGTAAVGAARSGMRSAGNEAWLASRRGQRAAAGFGRSAAGFGRSVSVGARRRAGRRARMAPGQAAGAARSALSSANRRLGYAPSNAAGRARMAMLNQRTRRALNRAPSGDLSSWNPWNDAEYADSVDRSVWAVGFEPSHY